MKHVEKALNRAATWAGLRPGTDQVRLLLEFAEWLVVEAIPAGGLGPMEAERVIDRHVADSLVFAAGWPEPPAALVDVGSGVGLPGIPMAIAFPDTTVRLLDRSERRTDLANRAIRILGLRNVEATHGDSASLDERYPAATFRGSLKPAEAVAAARILLLPGGSAMIGLRRGGSAPPAAPDALPGEVIEVLGTPDGVLDSPAWLLRMSAT